MDSQFDLVSIQLNLDCGTLLDNERHPCVRSLDLEVKLGLCAERHRVSCCGGFHGLRGEDRGLAVNTGSCLGFGLDQLSFPFSQSDFGCLRIGLKLSRPFIGLLDLHLKLV